MASLSLDTDLDLDGDGDRDLDLAVDPGHRGLWLAAVLVFGVGDVVTTHYGMATYDAIYEAHPLSNIVIGLGGTGGIIVMKTLAFGLAYVLYRKAPANWRVGVPIGLIVLGALIVANNLYVLRQAEQLQ